VHGTQLYRNDALLTLNLLSINLSVICLSLAVIISQQIGFDRLAFEMEI